MTQSFPWAICSNARQPFQGRTFSWYPYNFHTTNVALLIIFRTPWRWCSNACGRTVGRYWAQLQEFRNTYGPFTLGKRAIFLGVWRIWCRRGAIALGWRDELDCPWLLCLISLCLWGNCGIVHQGEWALIPTARHFLSWNSVSFARSNGARGHTALPCQLHSSVPLCHMCCLHITSGMTLSGRQVQGLAWILFNFVSHQVRCLCQFWVELMPKEMLMPKTHQDHKPHKKPKNKRKLSCMLSWFNPVSSWAVPQSC